MVSFPPASSLSFPSPQTEQSWQGALQLEFAYQDQATILASSHVQAPLKVQRPFYPESPKVCHAVVLHTAGGIVGGDRLNLDIHLHPQAQALVTTAAAGKVYRSNGPESQQQISLSIAEGGCLEWLPQEIILFNGANYRQTLTVELDAGALWMGWDVMRFGRSARGETFTTGSWRSRTEVWQQGQLLWVDPQWLVGDSSMGTSPHGLASCPVIGSFVVVGRDVDADIVDQARSLWSALHAAPTNHQTTRLALAQIGVTRLPNGLVCRYRGYSSTQARQWFILVWHLLRQELLQRAPCHPRVWPLC
jgi:urease accessory protein